MRRHIEFKGKKIDRTLNFLKEEISNVKGIEKISMSCIEDKGFLLIKGRNFDPFRVYSIITDKGYKITKVGLQKFDYVDPSKIYPIITDTGYKITQIRSQNFD